jgi:hypothetical protein
LAFIRALPIGNGRSLQTQKFVLPPYQMYAFIFANGIRFSQTRSSGMELVFKQKNF